jgi:hypothetical protein
MEFVVSFTPQERAPLYPYPIYKKRGGGGVQEFKKWGKVKLSLCFN